jgi:ribosomal protein L17
MSAQTFAHTSFLTVCELSMMMMMMMMMMQLRKIADEMVTVGKQGTLFARRRAQAVLRSDESIAKVFDVLATRYKDRAGGYTRVLRYGVLFWLVASVHLSR